MTILRILVIGLFLCGSLFAAEGQFDLQFSFDEEGFSHELCIIPGHRSLQISLACKTSWRSSSELQEFALNRRLREEVLDVIHRHRNGKRDGTGPLKNAIIRIVKDALSQVSYGLASPYSFQIQVQSEDLDKNEDGFQSSIASGSDFYLIAIYIQ